MDHAEQTNNAVCTRRFLIRISLFVLVVSVALQAVAHDSSLSAIRFIYRDKDTVVSVSTHISRLAQSQGCAVSLMSSSSIKEAVDHRLLMRLDGKSIETQNASVSIDKANDLVTWQTVVAPQPKSLDVLARLYPEDKLSQTVVTVVKDGQASEEYLLNAGNPRIEHEQLKPDMLAISLQFIKQGITHIFSGADHVLFVIGLLITGGGIRSLIAVITAFTIAHSITLGLSAVQILSIPAWFVEPAIALSIVAIGLENLRALRKTSPLSANRRLPYLAFSFGLIHGCGFASALSLVALNAQQLLLSLFSFNVGVEIGQGAIVLCLFPIISYLGRNKPVLARKIALVVSFLIATIGAIWFVQRL
ncbi:MAG: HupE/UreJ family protein [Candidatus Obscuribacterales bacterium]|nr:HupE/UreJ family protein [Candidatus Obscuribacterales bacterium]